MRNPPENYIQALQEHFSPIVNSWGVQPQSNIGDVASQGQALTTNQLGKITAFQRWFNFKEAFSPKFVIGAIESLGYKPTHIIDPFGGSGTTAITAQLLGIKATTIEVNPFLADIIAAKVTPIPSNKLRQALIEMQDKVNSASTKLDRFHNLPPTFIEAPNKTRWIFSETLANRIAQYVNFIESVTDIAIQRLLKVTLGSVLIPCSNVYINGKGRRYRRSWQSNQTTPIELDIRFRDQLQLVYEDSIRFEHRPTCETKIHNGDARIEINNIDDKADLIVFSPPYPNSFDYTDIYNVELWVLGYLESSIDNTALRKQTLRSHVQIKRNFDWPINNSPTLSESFSALEKCRENLWDKNIPEMVAAYFCDLEAILIRSRELITERGKLLIVVGDSKYANIYINVARILNELARGVGFNHIQAHEVRKMRTSAQQGGNQQLKEWILELSV